MKILSYIHPTRTYLPCTGVGRHINQLLSRLDSEPDVDLELLVSKEWLGDDGRLDSTCPLRSLPTHSFPTKENKTERSWKILGFPRMDKYIPDDTDWLYAPMETYFPISKCPVAVTIHDVQAFETHLPWSQSLQHKWFRHKWGLWVRRALNESRVVFTVSEFSKQRMVELLGADADKVVVVGNGVDRTFFDIATEDSNIHQFSPFDFPYVFMIGGLRQKKGGDYFLSVAKRLAQKQRNLKIVIAGKSDPTYERAAADCHNIVLLGVVPDEDVPRLFRHAVCLLFLSLYEGFGIPPLEAMAAGVPAVVANRASLPEIVGDAGIVVEPDHTDEIVDVLVELEKGGSLRSDYVQLGHKRVAQYSWGDCAEKVLSALDAFS
ncbi:MAG: glycosyltransferase family 1 protein [Bacteroidota bacterium]